MAPRTNVVGTVLSTVLAGTTLVSVAKADPPGDPSLGIVLLLMDRSSSMDDPGKDCIDETGVVITTPISKWQCAVKNAKFRVNQGDPTTSVVHKRYFVWLFGTVFGDPTNTQTMWSLDASGNPVRSGANVAPAAVTDGVALSRDQALSALNALDSPAAGPDASTPLAGAYCNAVTSLATYRALDTDFPLTVFLESDGLENSTPSTASCFGVDSTFAGYPYAQGNPALVDLTYNPATPVPPTSPTAHIVTADGLLVPSWQSNMLDMGVKGSVHLPDGTGQVLYSSGAFQVPPGMLNFTTDITFLKEFIGSSLASARSSRATSDAPAARAAVASAALSSDPGLDFFRGLAEVTGGRFVTYGDGAVAVPGDPTAPHVVPGDIDDSGCVDVADFNLLKQNYGKKTDPSAPITYAADITTDGRIDINDYLMLQAKFGTGCATSPGPVPVLLQSILGFDLPSNWTAPAVLGSVGVPHTEGIVSMSVAGKGWRSITSKRFATASFEGVKAALALDVAPPKVQSNPYWIGQVQVFADCPSAHIYNQPLGSIELTGKPLGSFSTLRFVIPSSVKSAMLSSHPDFAFTIALNANDPGYLFDNLRFVP